MSGISSRELSSFVRISVIGALFCGVPACTTALYNGSSKPPSQVASIGTRGGAEILAIDGTGVNGGRWGRYEVLPGRHLITLVGKRSQVGFLTTTTFTSRRQELCLDASPEHDYDVRAGIDSGGWAMEVIDQASEADVQGCEGAGPLPTSAAVDRSSAAVLLHDPKPGNGFSILMSGDIGGENLVQAAMSNGTTQTLSGGTGILFGVGASYTPLWIGDMNGVGLDARIGIKYDSIDASNASISKTSFPFSAGIHDYLRMSQRWYFTMAAGAHKEIGTGLSGSGDVAGSVSFGSPWGWYGEGGFLFAETWHTAIAFTVRYTDMRLTYAGQDIGANNVGIGLTLQINP
jgi:hypothetical protein